MLYLKYQYVITKYYILYEDSIRYLNSFVQDSRINPYPSNVAFNDYAFRKKGVLRIAGLISPVGTPPGLIVD